MKYPCPGNSCTKKKKLNKKSSKRIAKKRNKTHKKKRGGGSPGTKFPGFLSPLIIPNEFDNKEKEKNTRKRGISSPKEPDNNKTRKRSGGAAPLSLKLPGKRTIENLQAEQDEIIRLTKQQQDKEDFDSKNEKQKAEQKKYNERLNRYLSLEPTNKSTYIQGEQSMTKYHDEDTYKNAEDAGLTIGGKKRKKNFFHN